MAAPDIVAQPAPAAIAQDEILTGEAVALDVQPIGFFLRALGLLIDMVASVLLVLAFWIAALNIIGIENFTQAAATIATITTIVMVVVVIPTTVETVTRGRSLGKLIVGGRIVRADGGAIGFRHAFIRALAGVLEIWMTAGAVAGITAAFTPRAERVGDLMAGTYAERTRAPRLPQALPGVPPQLTDWARIADVARLPDHIARRASQYVRGAHALMPYARERQASALAADVRPYVSPVPAVDPDTLVRAVVAVRRDRDFAAVQLETGRVARLLGGVADAPRGFPSR